MNKTRRLRRLRYTIVSGAAQAHSQAQVEQSQITAHAVAEGTEPDKKI